MEPEKTDQEKLIKAAEAAAEQASETTEKVEEQHAEQNLTTPAAPTQPTPVPSEQPKPLIVPDSIVAPAKKKHTVRNVILIILGLLVLGCAGVAIWFFAYYNNSEKVTADALQNVVKSENLAINATYTQTGNDALTVHVAASANRHLPMSLSLRSEQSSTRLDARLDINNDGIIYASVDGLPEMLGVTNEIRQQAAALGEDLNTIVGFVDDVDAETWRIDIPEIVTELNLDKTYGEAYTCIIDQIQHGDSTAAITQAYTEYPFFNVKDATDNSLFHNSYNLTIDSAKFINFLNKVAGDPAAQTRHCFDNIKGVTVSDKASESEVEALIGEIPTFNIKVDWLSHQLTSVSVKDNANNLSVIVSYPDRVTVNAPDEYRSATELLDQFTDVVSIYLGNFATTTTTEVDFNCTTDTMNCTKSLEL